MYLPDFQAWQSLVMSAFGFLTTLIFAVEGLSKIALSAWNAIKELKGKV